MTRKEIKAHAARYTKFLEWSEEDECFVGRCPEIMAGGVHGNDEAKVYAELCVAVEEMVERRSRFATSARSSLKNTTPTKADASTKRNAPR